MPIIESRHVESNFVPCSCVCLVLCIYFFPFSLSFIVHFYFFLYLFQFFWIFLTFHLMQQVLRLNIRLDFTQLVKWIYFSLSPFLSSFFFISRSRQFFFLALLGFPFLFSWHFAFYSVLLNSTISQHLSAFMSQTFIIF